MEQQEYIRERERQGRLSRTTGIVLSISVHTILLACFFITGFTYLDPPPPEREQILIEFEEFEPEKPRQSWDGSHPQVERPEPEEEVRSVQKSEATHEGSKSNEAPEAAIGDQGDVEVPEPPREPEIDRRALFSAARNKTNKDTLAAQTADKVTDALKAGHAQGNIRTGETSGEPNAVLKGRSVIGTLPKPGYQVQESGKVVVEIWVDNYGNVQKAIPGAEGTTVTDKKLWQEARKAALGAHFNMSTDAPAMQKGTITYIFRLK